MADYTDLPDTAVGIGGIPSGTTVTALRDNAIAITEGAVGAPRIVDAALDTGAATAAGKTWVGLRIETSPVLLALAGASVGVVGTYAFCEYSPNAVIDPGDTTSGSNLNYTSAGTDRPGLGTLSGTWRCMGYADGTSSGADENTLFLRIS